jgi:DNA polymerase-1
MEGPHPRANPAQESIAMASGSGSLYLFDGHSLLFRAYHGIPHLSTSKGQPTNALYGFLRMVMKVLKDGLPDFAAVAFDTAAPTERHRLFTEYKATRAEMPEDLSRQLPYLDRLTAAMNLPVLSVEGYEADDLIATLAVRAAAQGMQVTLVSGDKDLLQLVSPTVRVYDGMKEKMYDVEGVRERFGVEPARVADVQALMGDAVDNVPGVPGVGEKTAQALIREFGSVERLLAQLDTIQKPKLREAIAQHRDRIRLNRQLVELKWDCPVDWNPEAFRSRPANTDLLFPLLRELEFTSLLAQWSAEPPVPPPAASPSVATAGPDSGVTVEVMSETGRLANLLASVREKGHCALALSSGPEGNHLGFCWGPDRAAVVPLKESSGELSRLLADETVKKYGHDLKGLLLTLDRAGLRLNGLSFDTQIAAYLIHPLQRDYPLETLVPQYLPRATTAGSQGTATETAGHRAGWVWGLKERLAPMIEEAALQPLLDTVEMPLIPILARMEQDGIRIDAQALQALSKELDQKMEGLMDRIFLLAGGPFNINSPKQLSEVLFTRLGLKPIKKTKTGYSTNEEVLQQLAREHELPAEILNYRQAQKLKSTYVDVLPGLVHPATGRLHTTWNQTGTATGRLSSTDPNLQNIPIRGEYGTRIRRAFVAEPGHRLLSADYSQIELRLLAHLSQDERLIEAFRGGRDVHTATAARLFGLSPENITTEMRRAAKTVNFGIIYGISPYGLSMNLGLSQNEAKQYIDQYFATYPNVKQYMDGVIRLAAEKGYVTTLMGRRRPIPELQSREPAVRSLGERTAVNTTVQGSAADLIKKAMIAVSRSPSAGGATAKLLLQIHDELVFEAPDQAADELRETVREIMEGVMPLSVPLTVDVGVGRNWDEAHS